MSGLALSAAALPTLARIGPTDLVMGVGSNRGVAEQELVVSAREGLLFATQLLSHPLTSRRTVWLTALDVILYPPRHVARPFVCDAPGGQG